MSDSNLHPVMQAALAPHMPCAPQADLAEAPLTTADSIDPATGHCWSPNQHQFWAVAARAHRQSGDAAEARRCERRAAELRAQVSQ